MPNRTAGFLSQLQQRHRYPTRQGSRPAAAVLALEARHNSDLVQLSPGRWQTESSQAYPAPAAMDLKKPEWLSQAKRLVGTGEGVRKISNVIPASPAIVTST